MFHAMYWNVILLILATISQGFGREPVCSKFHYEEQLLEKMIRQEIKLQEMESEIKKRLNNMDQKMESYKDEVSNSKAELQLIADKVDVPRIAFNVYNVNDIHVVNTGDVFVFTSIVLNEGNGYDTKTGIFTASVAGLYYFTAHMCNFPGKYIHYGIIVDDKIVATTTQVDKEKYSCNSVSAITVLTTGSSVSVQSTYSSSDNLIFQNPQRYVSFNGALLHQ